MPAKYELLRDDPIQVLGSPVYRIRALRHIPEHGVRKGDLGGYVEGEHNLAHDGAAWIADRAMAIQKSRVEGDALAAGLSIISEHALIAQNAVLCDQTQASGYAVVRGSARLSGLACARERVLMEGEAHAQGGAALTGEDTYLSPADAAWSLSGASSSDPDFDDRLREAIEIDPAFDLVFGQLDPAEPADILNRLARTNLGRRALHRLIRQIGGTFYPETYCPRDARAVTIDTAAEIADLHGRLGFTGFRSLCTISLDPLIDPDTGQRWHAGALRAVPTRASAPLFQPVLLEDISRSRALPPSPLRMTLLPEVYATPLDAEGASLTQLETLTSERSSRQHLGTSESITGTVLDTLPVIMSARGHGSGATRFLLTRKDGTFLSLIVPDHLCADLRFDRIVTEKAFDWMPDQLTAVTESYTLDIELPPPSAELAKVLARANHLPPPEGQLIMKRDMDLIRDLLINIEENENINGRYVISDADFSDVDADPNAIQYHLRLLLDAGYIEGRDLLSDKGWEAKSDVFAVMKEGASSGSQIAVERMTWEGHEFLDTVRDNQVWQKTKGYLQNVGGVGIDVLKDVAKAVIKDQITQYTGITFSTPRPS